MKHFFFVLIFIWSGETWAQSSESCRLNSPGQNNRLDLREVCDKSSACNSAYAMEAQKNYQEEFPAKKPRVTQKILGKNLKGTAEEIKAFRQILGSKPPRESAKLIGNCQTVLCAATNIFKSEEAAQRALAIASKTGYLISVDQEQNPKGVEYIWPEREVRIIDRALRKLPPHMAQMTNLKKIVRVARGYKEANSPRTMAQVATAVTTSSNGNYSVSGVMEVFDLAMDQPDPRESMQVIIHEMGHVQDYQQLQKTRDLPSKNLNFRQLSGWKNSFEVKNSAGYSPGVAENWDHKHPHDFVSAYSETSPTEDYAEAFAHYTMQPSKLKKTDPAKYEYMRKNVFKGQEYSDFPESLQLQDDETVLTQCLDQIESLQSSRISGRLQTKEGKTIWHSKILREEASYKDFEKLNCAPAIQPEKVNVDLCDFGGSKASSMPFYPNVFNSLRTAMDALNDEDTLAKYQSECQQQKDSSNQCIMDKIQLPGVPEKLRALIVKTFAEKYRGSSDYKSPLKKK